MNSGILRNPSDRVGPAPVGGVGGLTTGLDLDTMAAIAVEAGHDAVHGRGTGPPFGASRFLYAMSAEGDARHGTAIRLYQACLRGATDPATD